MRYGYKASAEQFGPRPLLNYSAQAEALGLDTVAIAETTWFNDATERSRRVDRGSARRASGCPPHASARAC